MNRMSLKKKLALGFGLLLVLLTATGGFNYFATSRLIDKVAEANDDMQKKEFSTEIELSVRRQFADVNDYVITDDEEALKRYQEDRTKLKTQLDQLSKYL